MSVLSAIRRAVREDCKVHRKKKMDKIEYKSLYVLLCI